MSASGRINKEANKN